MAAVWELPLFLAIFATICGGTHHKIRQKRETVQEQPRIITQNGHLIFQTGANHNISFKSLQGGFVNIDGIDIQGLVKSVKTNKDAISTIQGQQKTDTDNHFTRVEARITQLESWKGTHLQDIETINQLQTDMNTLKDRLTNIETEQNRQKAVTFPPVRPTVDLTDVRQSISALEDKVKDLWNKLSSNECRNDPCQNGGTCVDLYNGYICQCPDAWEGKRCQNDVNECQRFAGTDLGCQNGASCRNTQGSYTCQCTADWFGVHCTTRHDDCSGASQQELCGHGACADIDRTHSGQARFKCVCDEGWEKDGLACTKDKNECVGTNPPCSQDPMVQCINLPGTYHCGSCPAGFSGNGWHCVDVDECATNHGGCSQTPWVPCMNTRGSFKCGPCPPGYAGNGMTCMWKGRCSTNNGGCHNLARCIETPGVLGQTCRCPDGYIGSGVGRRGCRRPPTTAPDPCATNPCVNGRCQTSGSTYTCECDAGFSGSRCQLTTDNCASNPCQNGATCVSGRSSYTCVCPDTHTGTLCEEARQNCGGELSSDTGTIKYPQETGINYPHNIQCGWKITVASGKIIRLTFTSFNTESGSSCKFDFLAVHDGPSRGEHKIGQFCGTDLPNGGVVNSTHNRVFLYFQSDPTVNRAGFELRWDAVDPVCGGDLTGSDHGSISSPGYPGNYPSRTDCVWTVSVSPGKKIMFHFATLDLEHHNNCTYDYLEIRDGLQEADPVLAKFCSQADPSPITTQSPYAWVKFHTDSSESGRGFHITYSSVQVKADNQQCGEALTDSTGAITSPNYPEAYTASITCVWTITVPEGEKVILTFTKMDLEEAASSGDCTMDYIQIREGEDENGALVGTYCGSSVPATRTLTTNKVWVKFVTDDSAQRTGFRLTWDVACGGTFSEESGTVSSPYYPNNYPHNKECEYVLVNPTGGQVTIEFEDFGIEQVGDDCEYDYLEVRDGRTKDAGLLQKLCGSETPNPISSNGRSLYLKFVSDGSTSNKGFKINYEMNTQTCGRALTANNGVIQSPGFPNMYPHGVSCTWTIDVDPGYIIRLTFHSFSTEKTTNCRFDSVAVYDNSSYTDTGGLIGRYCGATLPPASTTIENTMTIVFSTDGNVAHEGFMATYIALNASHLCGGQMMTETGVIMSPNFPENYPHLRECIWTIVIAEGHQIMLNVTDFQMEDHARCKYDFLEIRNGGYASSPLMGQFCGSNIPTTFVSQSNRMFIKFKTDTSDSSKGFRIFYDGRASGCGADLSSPSGSFISPNFPLPYGHHAECFWTVTVSEGSTVMLLFAEFDLEHGSECNYDYLEIRDRDRNGPVLAKLCSSVIPQPVKSKTNKIWVKFKTDYSSHGRGFHAVYHSNCEVTLTSVSGVIESPNFPNPYPGKRSCAWKIQSTYGNKLNVSFSHFGLEEQSTCSSDYLEVFDGTDETATSLGKYCGNELPPNMASSDRFLLVKFISDYTIGGTGFRLEWLTDGCGANLKGRSGRFTSPNYPNPYPVYKECVWTIEVNPGQRVELTFEDMDIEHTVDCKLDYIEVFGGPDQTAPSLTKLCHTSTKPQKLTSTGNFMFIRFYVKGGNSGRGFKASYEGIAGGCGGNFTTKAGTLMSPGYPSKYPHNTDCSWLITVDENANIEMMVEDFAMEVTTSGVCQYDYLAFYDGPDYNARLIQKLCGKNISENSSVITHGNQLYMRMRSDSSVTDSGFKAVYVTGCGGMRDASTDGAITSPNYPEEYTQNKNCTWVIQSPRSDDKVTLTFTYLDILESEDCVGDHVEVHEGDDELSPLIGSYCGQRVPPTFTSRGSALTVVFTSGGEFRRTSHGHGFRAVYTSAAGACGGQLTSQHGAFISPEYGVDYPLNRECVWTIGGPPGSRIQISAKDFSIPSTANCDNDFLDVRDGGETSRTRWRFCGTEIPTNMSFTSNKLWVRFRSSNSIPSGQTYPGFYFYYSIVYGGEINGDYGKIASPNYPKLYPRKLDIEWTITVAVGKRIRIVMDFIDMETNPKCFYDYLTFYDGATADDPLINTFCGFEEPEPFLSNGNQLHVKFHSDWNREGHGFVFRWMSTDEGTLRTTGNPLASMNVTCGQTLMASGQVQNLSSPNYPSNYGNKINCMWKIEAPEGSRVWINVTRVDVEGRLPSCFYDKLEFYDGDGVESTKLTTLCGRQVTGDAVVSTSTIMTVRFYTDVGLSGSGFTSDVKTACGGRMTSSVGVIKSPDYPSQYGANQNCTWNIQVTNGRKLALEFDNFNIRSTSGCSEDYLQLVDGAFADSPPLGNGTNGRYCGTTAPKLPDKSSSNNMIVQFVSSPTSPGGAGFSFTYREVTITCGGRLTLTNSVQSGTFMSHGYPMTYPANVDCIWIITAPSSDGVQLDFDRDFDIEKHRDCKFDNIEIRDGGTENAPLIGRYCGSDSPGTVKSSGNVLYARFRTDDSIPRKGFKATYKIATCGGTLRGKDGYISSPNYPHTYPSNTECEWFIYGLTGHYLTLTFTALQLENSVNCTKDFVEIREYNATGRLFGKYCGTTVPTLGDTSDSYAYIKFKSDDSSGRNGFKLKFESGIEECGGDLVNPTGVIQSPNYPGLYPHMRICTWKIKVQEGRRVTLTFEDFKLEASESNCFFDHVSVKNSIAGEAPIIATLCGSDTPDVLESSSNSMTVIFKTDGSVSNGGFKATYTSDNPARCGGEVAESATSGIIKSPNFDLGYYNHSEMCVWTITNQNLANSSIGITFTDFELETHWNCDFDYLKITETTNQVDRLINQLCGNKTLPKPIVSPSPKLTLMFRTDASLSMKGFKLAWKIQRCGGLLTASSGEIVSPNYPRNYNMHDKCAWEILSPEGYQIKITFQDMNIEDHDKCGPDYLKILNGGSASSPSIGKFCGTDIPKNFISQSNQLRLEFQSDYSVVGKGFKLKYEFISGGCGGVMHSYNGSIVKPTISANSGQVECIWDIIMPYGFHVRFEFTKMAFDCSNKNEFVELLDIGKNGVYTNTKTFCVRDGDILPEVYDGLTNKLRVRYRTPNLQSSNTFAANWSVGCGYLLTADEGIVMSPLHPKTYPGNLDCNYTISVDPQKFIVLEFDEDQFGIERAQIATNNSETLIDNIACKFDYVAVYDGFNDSDARLIGKFCGNKAPQALSSVGNMIVRFKSDRSVGDVGFLANYRASECGGIYTEATGAIRTPQHPVKYHRSANCSWLITIQEDRAVQLKFTTFEIELHRSCSFDYVEIFDGDTTDAPSLGRFCGKEVPPVQRTVGNQMLVIFKSDHSVQLGGFTAAYETTFGINQGCGGTLNGENGRISSIDIDYNGQYENDQDCIWQILADIGKVIKLTFTVFDLERPFSTAVGEPCRYDFVEIRDGYTFESPSAGRFCGDQTPAPFTSSSNRLYIRFKSDSSDGGQGFNATWQVQDAQCGGYINLTDAAPGPFSISSPNYPQPYPHGLRCRWTIEAPVGKHVMLNMTDYDIRCVNQQTLEFRDMPLGSHGKNVFFCRPETNRMFYSLNSTVEVDLVTDQTSSGKGFNLTYQISTCNRTYTGDNGHVYSPGWPREYARYSKCTMYIQAPPGHKISIFFNTFAVEMHSKCKYDYLAFEDPAIKDNTTLLARYCGYLLPDPLFTDLNRLRVQFRSDGSLAGIGFDINYITSPTGCGGNLTSSNGSFTSPGYPGNVTQASDCVWLLHAPANTRNRGNLKLMFLNFNLGGTDGTCGDNYVEIRTGLTSSGNIYGKYCGSEKPSDLYLRGDGYVRYKTDGKSQGIGFRLAFEYRSRQTID